MKRNKLLFGYYTRLTLVSLTAVCILLSISVLAILSYRHNAEKDALIDCCEDVVEELTESFESIWADYYKAFLPFSREPGAGELLSFCREEDSGLSRYRRNQILEGILLRACQQDRRIRGIYFRRLSDESRYLYSDAISKLVEVDFQLGSDEDTKTARRTPVGGQLLGERWRGGEQGVYVFGIQSGLLSCTQDQSYQDYQMTVLYDLEVFDEIVGNHEAVSQARFYITTMQGMILYDSQGEYAFDQPVFLEDIRKISGGRNTFTSNGTTWLKGLGSIGRSGCLVFYVIPEKAVTGFRLDNVGKFAVVFAVALVVALIFVMGLSNRVIGKRFQELERGMSQVGKNDLTFRLPVDRRENEFSRIADRFNRMCEELEEAINKNYRYRILQQKAEYKALQKSLNPHFLYNSLEVIRVKLEREGQRDVAEMVVLLSRIYEYQTRGAGIVTIRREKEFLENYIDFYSIRSQYNFEYSVEFEREILDCAIPKQIIQPVIENYFVHGFRGDGLDVIQIRGYQDQEDGKIHICFEDNGKGLDRERESEIRHQLEQTEENSSHIGLWNVHKRLQILFGEESGVRVAANAPLPGVSVSLVFSRRQESEMTDNFEQ